MAKKKPPSRLSRFTSLKQLLMKYEPKPNRQITKEYQLYGLELANELDDWAHKSLYIRLAKTSPRDLVEKARFFVKDAPNVKNRAKLFMWKLKQLKATAND